MSCPMAVVATATGAASEDNNKYIGFIWAVSAHLAETALVF
jgi:hypothetical protein